MSNTTPLSDEQRAENLLPCPFCRSASVRTDDYGVCNMTRIYCIGCDACGEPKYTPEEAIAAWNVISANAARVNELERERAEFCGLLSVTDGGEDSLREAVLAHQRELLEWCASAQELERENAALRERVDELKEAIVRYGNHLGDCACVSSLGGCSCGLNELLRSLGTPSSLPTTPPEAPTIMQTRKTLTLVFKRPRRRDWGFYPGGVWEQWQAYFKRLGC